MNPFEGYGGSNQKPPPLSAKARKKQEDFLKNVLGKQIPSDNPTKKKKKQEKE